MDGLRLSDRSFVSDLSDDLDRVHTRDEYELDDVSRLSTATLAPEPFVAHQDEQRLLAASPFETEESRSTWPSVGETPADDAKPGKLVKVADFLHAHNPATKSGRHRIKVDVARSGPVTRASTDLDLSPQSGFRGRWKLHGWRFGVFLSVIAVSICLLVELVMLICAVTLNKSGGQKHGIGVLYVGKCAKVERITKLLAIPLNIIATVLVATSNYVMQCLSAPSRKDLNTAHAAGSFLHIGIPSVHNLVHNFSRRSLLWLVLLLSTIPIHLLLNSAFFGALQANNYGILVASNDWLTDDLSVHMIVFNDTGFNLAGPGQTLVKSFTDQMVAMAKSDPGSAQLQRMDREACFATYSTSLQSEISNVVVVVDDSNSNFSLIPSISAVVGTSLPMDPMTSWDTRDGVGVYLNPFSGNGVPVLDGGHHWIYQSTLPQNTSGGLYMLPDRGDGVSPSIRGVFSSFDYRYWMTTQQLAYDFNQTDISRAGQFDPTSWLCDPAEIMAGKSCTSGKNPEAPDPWRITPEQFEVDYCLSQSTEEQCQLQYSFIILIVVIICDIAKILAMAVTLWATTDEPLATIGDAIASFLEQADPTTQGCCLLDQKLARQLCRKTSRRWKFWNVDDAQTYEQANKTFAERLGNSAMFSRHRAVRWWSVPSRNRWGLFLFLYTTLLALSVAVLALGVRDLHRMGIDNPLQQGFGSINPNAVFAYGNAFDILSGGNTTYQITPKNKEQSLFADVITVNTPQLLFSMLYFLYNGMFTSMVTAAEWSLFATTPKALRVSQPRKGQRSTYWLQLPWKYSLPLLSMSILLHFLVSRSLFVIRINVIGWNGEEQGDRDISACGYSPLAILIVIIIVVVSLVVMVVVGRQKLDPDIPACGTNSVAISAACHYTVGEGSKVVTKPLRWGVTEAADDQLPGHCSIADEVIGLPVDGERYV